MRVLNHLSTLFMALHRHVLRKLPGNDADLCGIAKLGQELLAILSGEAQAWTSATPILATTSRMVGRGKIGQILALGGAPSSGTTA